MGIVSELCYVDGVIWKETLIDIQGKYDNGNNNDGGLISTYPNYIAEEHELISVKTSENNLYTKVYKPSFDLFDFCGKSDISDKHCINLDMYDLSPNFELVMGAGICERYVDIFFLVKDEENLKEISKYYGLPHPLPENSDIDSKPQFWQSLDVIHYMENLNVGYIDEDKINKLKLGSVKFQNNKPVLLKLYKSNHKPKNYI